jgi:FkbM family methyltransferase
MIFFDNNNNLIDTNTIEKQEQDLANKYILPSDVVLELGARYGTVSCTINKKLFNKSNQVVVEPDSRVWESLEKNKNNNNCHFNIVKGFISDVKLDVQHMDDEYGTTSIINENSTIDCYTLQEIKEKYNIQKFNFLIADCEGGLGLFLRENPSLYNDIRMIIFEADYPEKCDYNLIKNNLRLFGFTKIEDGFQNVWIKIDKKFLVNKNVKYVKNNKKMFMNII